MKNQIEKGLLGVTGEYAVAAELGKRNIYAQITLGNQKRTDLLIYSTMHDTMLKVEVKCKQKDSWPNCKGISKTNSVIIFVDFRNLKALDRPIFYILDINDWTNIVTRKELEYRSKYPERRTKIEENVLILLDETKGKGKPYSGCTIKNVDLEGHKESWDKIITMLK